MPAPLQLHTAARNWRKITVTTVLSWLMKLMMAGLVPFEIYRGNYLFSAAIAFAVLVSLIPSLVRHNYNVTLPFEFDFLITISIFAHTFLGEGFDFYERFWLWDKVLHLYGAAVIGLLAFAMAYTLHYTGKLRLTLPLIGLFTVVFALAAGAVWEICEFTVDQLFARNTQKGLTNTMVDLINDLIGGSVAAGLGMVYVRYKKTELRKRLDKPVGEVMGLGDRVDRIKEGMKERRERRRANRPFEGRDRRR